ncbi:MAG: ribonuclease P protein component [Desulfovibrio sp.]|nr:ribonuclease P protein component [Pseudodesulfovibrio profundus]MBC15640.1 ribonuclease P protein component [Desulfovibrio sp.]
MSRLAWNKERRLLKSPQFTVCYERGRKHFTRNFILFVKNRDTGQGGLRLGLTVSKKMGNAVARNRIKRVVREYFRLHQYDFELPLDIVVVPKRNLEAKQLTLALAKEEFTPLLTRIRTEAASS